MARLPCDGLLVVALEHAVAAPYATRLLADAGARVIKVERPEGDFARGYDRAARGESSYFLWLNRGKESVCLDLRAPDDRKLFDRLVARADVLVQNLAPGAADRLGIGAGRLRDMHPRLVSCTISGFGPGSDRKGYDLIVQAETGLASVTGTPEAPGRVGISICDIATGAMAHGAILEALLARERGGQGADLHVSLFDVMAEWMTVPYLHARYGEGPPERIGLAHPSIAPYGAFRLRDGSLIVAVQNEREWRTFCASILGSAELALDDRFSSNVARVANRAALDAIVAGRLANRGIDEAIGELAAAGIAYGRVNDVGGLVGHSALRTVSAKGPGGRMELPAPPVCWSEIRKTREDVPPVGGDTAAVRIEFTGSGRKDVEVAAPRTGQEPDI